MHPELKGPLKKLSDDPKTTIVVLSGSDRSVLDEVLQFFKIAKFYGFHVDPLELTFFFQNRTLVNSTCG